MALPFGRERGLRSLARNVTYNRRARAWAHDIGNATIRLAQRPAAARFNLPFDNLLMPRVTPIADVFGPCAIRLLDVRSILLEPVGLDDVRLS
jgi:hypothetical protein